MVEKLLKNGANPNITNKNDYAPFNVACVFGKYVVIFEIFIQILFKYSSGGSFLGHEDVLDLLLRYGADINHPITEGMSPLHMAASEGIR